jgi:hypothetical protein
MKQSCITNIQKHINERIALGFAFAKTRHLLTRLFVNSFTHLHMTEFLLITGILCFSACMTNQSVTENRILLLAPDKPQATHIFENCFELESIVPVETTNDLLISGIKKVLCYKDKIIILARKTHNIFIINASTGKAEAIINRIGNGPGESKSILDITVDDQEDRILVFNDYDKLLFFTLEGDFLKEEAIKGTYEYITYDKGNVLFYNVLDGYSCYPYAIDIYNLKDRTWKKTGTKQKVDFAIRNFGRQIVKSKNIWFVAPLSFDMQVINDTEIEVPYKLEVEASLTDEDLIKKSSSDPRSFFRKVLDDKIIYSISSIRETDHHLLLKPNLYGFYLVNKATLEVQWIRYVDDKYSGLKLTNYYPHEGDDNRVMFIVQAEEWMNRSFVNPENIPQQWKEKINAIKVEEDSNPILLFYKEKTSNE